MWMLINWEHVQCLLSPRRGRLDPRSTFLRIIKMSRHKMVSNGHVSKDDRKVQVSRERQTFQLSRTLNKTSLGQQLLQIWTKEYAAINTRAVKISDVCHHIFGTRQVRRLKRFLWCMPHPALQLSENLKPSIRLLPEIIEQLWPQV